MRLVPQWLVLAGLALCPVAAQAQGQRTDRSAAAPVVLADRSTAATATPGDQGAAAAPALPLCRPADTAAIQAALAEAPEEPIALEAPPPLTLPAPAPVPQTAPETPAAATPGTPDSTPGAPATAVAQTERRCGVDQARQVLIVLRRCSVQPKEAVLYLGAGRCLHQAGLRQEAARAYHAYLETGDPTVSRARVAERRERVRRWLADLGQPDPGTAPLVIRSNLRGALVRHLEGYPDGLTIDAGDTRLLQPPGSRTLSLTIKGFERVDLPVDLLDDVEARVSVDWREHLAPQYARLRPRWDDFSRSGLTPAGYSEKRGRPVSIAGSLLFMAGGGALLGVCAANVNGACNASWQQGLAYSFGALLSAGGLISLLATVLKTLDTLPAPGLSGAGQHGAAERATPERLPYY